MRTPIVAVFASGMACLVALTALAQTRKDAAPEEGSGSTPGPWSQSGPPAP